MKKNLSLAVFVICVMLCGFKPADTWEKYSSAEGHFAISFPGKPEENTEADAGSGMTFHFVTYAKSDDEVYLASWVDMSGVLTDGVSMKALLEGSRDSAAASMKAANIKTTATNLGDKPYIEFSFSAEDLVGKDRIYIINKVQYSIIAMYSKKTGILPGADKFITSFKSL